MSYGYVCRNCVFARRMCDGYMDENGHCDLKTTPSERRREIVRGLVSVLVNTVLIVGGGLVLTYATIAYARHTHEKDCTGTATGKCSWAWCDFYDGSDNSHDFNLNLKFK